MKIKTVLLITSLLLSIVSTASRAQSPSPANPPIFQKLDDAKWDKILPDLGDNSPEICILEIGPGGFNFMPAKMVHEAWLPADSLTFITVDAAWDVNWEGPPTPADLTK